ncbi:hypothetical protein pb186bvf_012651 [Paramecium bursaria]
MNSRFVFNNSLICQIRNVFIITTKPTKKRKDCCMYVYSVGCLCAFLDVYMISHSFDKLIIMFIDQENQLPQLDGDIFGIDIECKNNIICLIQIQNRNSIYLIDALGIQLKQYLQNFFNNEAKKIFYCGQQDLKWLKKQYDVDVNNYCDLKILAQKEQDDSLIGLWEKYCGVQFSREKKKLLQLSDWSQRPLSEEQLNYAALDCKYLIGLYEIIVNQFTQDELSKLVYPKIKEKKFLKQLEIEVKDQQLAQIIYRHIKLGEDLPQLNENVMKIVESYKKQGRNEKKEKKLERFLQFQQKYTIHKPVYSNCKILDNEGRQLCYCDRKKLQWYISHDLAQKVDENTIRLNFKPQAEYDEKEMNFYNTERQSMCVVCGVQENYLKYQIVPYIYKHHFPVGFKSHRAHDVVLLCTRCHEKASANQDKLKLEISKQYQIPLHNYGPKQEHVKIIGYIIKKLQFMIKSNIKIDIGKEYNQIQNIYGLPEIADLQQLIQLKDELQKNIRNTHGEDVNPLYISDGSLILALNLGNRSYFQKKFWKKLYFLHRSLIININKFNSLFQQIRQYQKFKFENHRQTLKASIYHSQQYSEVLLCILKNLNLQNFLYSFLTFGEKFLI